MYQQSPEQLQPTFAPGDFMSIPKGTKFHKPRSKYSSPDPVKDETGVTTREAVVRVASVVRILHDTDTVDVCVPYYQCFQGGGGESRVRMESRRKVIGYYVRWADGKYVHETLVTKADEPVRKAPDPAKANEVKAPTLRMRMVKGTKWKLTKDAKLVKAQGYKDPIADGVIPAGTVIEIVDKFTTYGPSYADGLWVPIAYPGYKQRLVLFSELNQEPEQVGEAEVIPVFYIWDTVEKKYYSGYDYAGFDKKTFTRTHDITYSEKLSKAKSFKMLNLVRTHALIQSGYYDNLPEGWGQIPEWMQGSKVFDIPDTWEIVKIDKLTKKEIARFELVDTFKRTWKLRALTIKYGSAVRAVYSALEKKGDLDKFSAMLSFSLGKDKDGYFRDDEIPESEKDAIKELLTQFDKKDIKIHKSQSGFAVGAKDAMTAMMVKLAYTGDLECALIDFTTMGEVVANGA
jgi:hypothetical protein